MQGLRYSSSADSDVTGGDDAACKLRPANKQQQLELMGCNLLMKTVDESPVDKIRRLTTENAVLVFSMTSCCMCHVVKRLLCSLGVHPAVCELDEEEGGLEMEKILRALVGGAQKSSVPAVFIGGNLIGGLDRVMAMHIEGDLVPKLKEAKALWL